MNITWHDLLLILLLFTYSCRSHKQEHNFVQEKSNIQTKDKAFQRDSVANETATSDSLFIQSSTSEYIRTVSYRDNGTIQAVQEQWRESGYVRLDAGSRRSSSVRVIESKTDTSVKSRQKFILNEIRKAVKDNRLIQGADWYYLLIGVLSVILIIIGLRKMNKW